MKRITKRFITFTIVCIMLCSALTVTAGASAKKVYWLSGISRSAGGNMRMYYKNENTILLKGKLRKSSSMDGLPDAEEKKGSYSLKVARNCKVILVEADNVQTIDYVAWAEGLDYENGDEISFIDGTVKVKNKKIVKIYFSA